MACLQSSLGRMRGHGEIAEFHDAVPPCLGDAGYTRLGRRCHHQAAQPTWRRHVASRVPRSAVIHDSLNCNARALSAWLQSCDQVFARQRVERLPRHGTAVKIALSRRTTMRAQNIGLGTRFHTLCNGANAERFGHTDDGTHDRDRVWILAESGNEAAVDLDSYRIGISADFPGWNTPCRNRPSPVWCLTCAAAAGWPGFSRCPGSARSSVISSSRRDGMIPVSWMISITASRKPAWCNCTGETLTAIPIHSGQVVARRQASRSTQSPIGTIRPVSPRNLSHR